ncbi:hypothetical protein BDQ17DRAFT_1369862 [Cyathus striatus]|nr:hypothetical protein BDQ17DRAFT_1369862 [Cyathus striatus]
MSSSTLTYLPTLFRPREEDVHILHGYFLNLLPAEVISIILDKAEYWPRQIARYTTNRQRDRTSRSTWVYLTAPSVPQTLPHNSVKKIVFWIKSHEMGYHQSGVPAYLEWAVLIIYQGEASQRSTEYSGFIHRNRDLSAEGLGEESFFKVLRAREEIRRGKRRPPTEEELEAAHIDLVPNPVDGRAIWPILCTSSNTGQWYKVEWRRKIEESEEDAEQVRGASFVQSVLPGDRVGIIAKAHFYGWVNSVDEIVVEVFYSV